MDGMEMVDAHVMDDKWRDSDLSHEVHVRQDEQSVTKIARSVHAQVMCMLRVSLFML